MCVCFCSAGRAELSGLVLSGLRLRCQSLTFPQRRRTDVHPKCFPPAPRCCTFMEKGRGRDVFAHKQNKLMSRRSALHFYEKQSFCVLRAHGLRIAASDARRTQPLLKLRRTFRHPGRTITSTDNRTQAARHTTSCVATHKNGRNETRKHPWSPTAPGLTCCSCACGQDGALSFPAPLYYTHF